MIFILFGTLPWNLTFLFLNTHFNHTLLSVPPLLLYETLPSDIPKPTYCLCYASLNVRFRYFLLLFHHFLFTIHTFCKADITKKGDVKQEALGTIPAAAKESMRRLDTVTYIAAPVRRQEYRLANDTSTYDHSRHL